MKKAFLARSGEWDGQCPWSFSNPPHSTHGLKRLVRPHVHSSGVLRGQGSETQQQGSIKATLVATSFLRRQLRYEKETHRGQHHPGSGAPDPTGASVSYSISLVGFLPGSSKGTRVTAQREAQSYGFPPGVHSSLTELLGQTQCTNGSGLIFYHKLCCLVT